MTTGHRLFFKEFLHFNTMHCRRAPFLVHFWHVQQAPPHSSAAPSRGHVANSCAPAFRGSRSRMYSLALRLEGGATFLFWLAGCLRSLSGVRVFRKCWPTLWWTLWRTTTHVAPAASWAIRLSFINSLIVCADDDSDFGRADMLGILPKRSKTVSR